MKISELFYSIQGEGKLIGVPSVFIRTSGCNLRCVWCDTPYASWNPEGDDWSIEKIIQTVQQLLPVQHNLAPTLPWPSSGEGSNSPPPLEGEARGGPEQQATSKTSTKHISTTTRYTGHVVLTGGEPMIMPQIQELCQALHDLQYHITIETAATVYKPVHRDLASLSPKLSNSTPHDRENGKYAAMHEKQRINIPVIQDFIDNTNDFQLKFVVSSEQDLNEIDALLAQINGWQPSDIQLMPEGTDVLSLRSRAPWIGEICKQRGFRYSPRLHVEMYGNKRGT